MGSLALTQAFGITLGELGAKKVRALAAALDLSEQHTAHALRVFELMSESWSDWALGDAPVWQNDISDDGTPFEFSASFDGEAPRLRMLVESQAAPISRTSSWAAGLRLGERLEAQGLADLSMLEPVAHLFAPSASQRARFLLWHAAVVQASGPALFKAYVNPCLRGADSAPEVVRQALRTLGFDAAWDFLEERLRTSPGAEIRYFSVDLEAPEHARVKVYLGCSQSAEAVDRLIAGSRNSEPADAERWLDVLTASQGPFSGRPILSCFSFRRGIAAPDVTVHVPIRCHVKHDADALSRVARLLTETDAERLERALTAVSERPLSVGRGLLTYASLRREAGVVRVTVYLAPEAYAISSRRPTAPPPQRELSSGVHKASGIVTSPPPDRVPDSLASLDQRCSLFAVQPVFALLASPSTVARRDLLASHLLLLHFCLGDLLHVALAHTSELPISACLSTLGEAMRAPAAQFQATIETLGLERTSFFPFSSEQSVLREVAYARVADVISATDDHVRLALVLSTFFAAEQLVTAGLRFLTRSVPAEGASVPYDAPSPVMDLRSDCWLLALSGATPDDVDLAVERSLKSMLKACDAIARSTLGA